MSGNNRIIAIRATSKRNGITTTLIGVGLIALSMVMLSFFSEYVFLVGIFIASAGIVGVLMGWFKMREPNYSIEITPDGIRYLHRRGEWFVEWDNIQRIDAPRVTRGIEMRDLEMVGLRLKDSEKVVASISPRLATNILMEQRPLLLQNPDESCQTGACGSGDLLEEDKFKLSNGTLINGVSAMFANRMKRLREQLGFDLYIAAAELDRPVKDFVILLKDCHQQVQQEAQ